MARTWFITGASRGFGKEWAIAALERGDDVEFALGQQTGVDLVDAGRGGHRVGDLGGVAGEHDDGTHAGVV